MLSRRKTGNIVTGFRVPDASGVVRVAITTPSPKQLGKWRKSSTFVYEANIPRF